MLRATASIADPAEAADLHRQLSDALFGVDLMRSAGAGHDEAAIWIKDAIDVIERIESISLRH